MEVGSVGGSDKAAAQSLAVGLHEAGCSIVFGVPGGGPNLDVVGALADHNIDFMLAHTETAACIMAATWGWLSDTISAAVVTRGPGAASAVNGAAQATLDRQPLLLISDTVPVATRARVPHQRIDQRAMLGPVSKQSAVIGSETGVDDVAVAIDIARTWPAGTVHLDYDMTAPGTTLRFNADRKRFGGRAPVADADTVQQAARLVAGASKPVVIVGAAAVPAADDVRSSLLAFGAPVLTTYQASGIVPTEHDVCAGLFTNGASERPLLDQADLIITIGLDMVEPIPAPWTYDTPVVSLAPVRTKDPYLPTDIEVVGDLMVLLRDVFGDLRVDTGTAARDHRQQLRAELMQSESTDGFGPVALVRSVVATVPEDTTVTVDAGAHFLAIMPLWPVASAKRLLISNGLATMGYAVPAAIGAALARPGEPVVALTGDGGLGMCLAELETIARRALPITVIVFNDAALSLIEIKQQPHHGDDRSVRYQPTDFAAVADGMGVPSIVAASAGELEAILANHDHTTPLLIDAHIDPSSYPHLLKITRG